MTQDILITPGSGEPQILFRGSGVNDTPVELNTISNYSGAHPSGTSLTFQGSEGALLTISDNLSSGILFSVADISGLPVIEVNASGYARIGGHGAKLSVGSTSQDPEHALDVFGSGNFRQGIIVPSQQPATTGNALYNIGGTLYFNGSTVGGGGSSYDDTYVSGIATYASGNTANIAFGSDVEGDILYHDGTSFTRLAKGTNNYVLTMNGNVPNWEASAGGGGISQSDFDYASGIANYASGQAIANETDVVATSGVAAYASGQAITNKANIATNTTNISTNVSNISTNVTNISTNTARVTYASGQAIANEADIATNVTNIATNTSRVTYASGQSIANESDIVAVSGIAHYASGHAHDDLYVSGVAAYASGQAIENEAAIATNVTNIATNVTNIATNTSRVIYASGQAIANEGDIVATSGIANYASGQAIANEADIATNLTNITSNTNIATYASGQVNVGVAGTADASKAIILDSSKSFTGVKDGVFNQFDSWVRTSGVDVGASGIVLANNTPTVTTNTLYNDGGTLSWNGSAANTTYTAGDGLDLVGTTFSTDLKSNGGIVVEGTELAVDLGASSITGTLADGDIASASTWNAKQAALTFGITDTNAVKIDGAGTASGEYAKFTSSGIVGEEVADVKTDLSLNLVENTALSTWAGTTSITTLSTITTGVWQGTAIDGTYIDIEGTEIKSTGPEAATKYLRADGDGTCSWQTVSGGVASNSFETISVSGQDNVVAESATDTLTLVNGSNVTITTNAGTDTITIAADDTEYTAGDGLDLATTTFSVDLKANGGLVIESTEIAVDLGASSITGTLADGDIASAATWNAKQAALTFGIADTNAVKIDDADAADNDYAKLTATGLEGKSYSEVKIDLSLDSVENTALSTWAGTTNVNTLGTVTGGTWNATAIGASYLPVLNSITAPTGDVSLNSNKITSLTDPTAAQDAATKSYVDAIKSGLDIKDSCVAATTAAGTLATSFKNGDVIDGVTLVTNERILIKDQSTGSENGIYTVNASGAPTRATDFDADSEVTAGVFTFIEEGTANGDAGFVLTTNDPITVGSTALTFTQFSGAGQITAGDGLTKSGNTIDAVGTSDKIDVSADAITISPTYVGQGSITTVGALAAGSIATGFGNIVTANTLDISSGTLTTSAAQNLAIVQGAASNIDIGTFSLTANTLVSDVVTGTSPLTVTSTTLVANLNADLLDGQEGSYYLDYVNFAIDDDEIPIAKLASDSVSYGGVEVTLGASDATPAFALDDATGLPIVGGTTGTLSVARGGTGASSLADKAVLITQDSGTDTVSAAVMDANGELLIGGTDGPAVATLTQGSNVIITNGNGSITIAATDNNTTYTAGDGLDLTGTAFSTDLKSNGGIVIESTELAVDLGASSITGTLDEGDGGTGLTSIATLLNSNVTPTTLSLVIGTNVQAYDADLTAIAGLASTDSNFIVGSAGGWVAESGATARTSLGVDATGTDNSPTTTIAGSYDYISAGGTKGHTLTLAQIDLAADVTGTLPVGSVGTITLGTNTAGNYVGTVTGGTGITSTGATSGEGIAHSLSVDAAQTQITSVGTLASVVVADGGNIGSASDTDAISIASTGTVTFTKVISVPVSSTNVPTGSNPNKIVSINVADANFFRVQLAASDAVTAINFTDAAIGQKFIIRIEQPASGTVGTVTWADVDAPDATGAVIYWPGGTAPTLTATNSKADVVGFMCIGKVSTTFYFDAFIIGQNM